MTGYAVDDERRPPFLWLELGAVRRIRQHVPDRRALGVRSVYLALAELAADQHDGLHQGFEATRREIADRAGAGSMRTVDSHVAELERLGLVRVKRQTTESGRDLGNRYVLTSPGAMPVQERAPGEGATNAPVHSLHGEGASSALEIAPPTRARLDAVEEREEEGEREGERPREASAAPIERPTELEAAALSELGRLGDARGLDAIGAPEILAAMRAHPGLDHLAAAKRLARYYGPGGKAENRPIADLAALFRTELERSTEARAGGRKQRPNADHRGGSRPPRRPSLNLNPRPITEADTAAWTGMRTELEAAVSGSAFAQWLEPLELVGVDPGRGILLYAPPDIADWTAQRFGKLLEGVAAAAFGPGTGVELTTTRAAAA